MLLKINSGIPFLVIRSSPVYFLLFLLNTCFEVFCERSTSFLLSSEGVACLERMPSSPAVSFLIIIASSFSLAFKVVSC